MATLTILRIIALAVPPTPKNPWLTSEVLSMFHFHNLPTMTILFKNKLLRNMFPDTSQELIDLLLKFDDKVREANEKEKNKQSLELSLRQLIRICKHVSLYPDTLYVLLCSCTLLSRVDAINRALMAKFMPVTAREVLEKIYHDLKIKVPEPSHEKLVIEKSETHLKIGNISVTINKPRNPALVPKIVFYEVPKHIFTLQQMLQDWLLGEPMLLIGCLYSNILSNP
jgi:hypothetical protein